MTLPELAKLTVVVDANTIGAILDTVEAYLAEDPNPELAAAGLRFKRIALAAGLGAIVGPVSTPYLDAAAGVISPLEPRVIKPAEDLDDVEADKEVSA